MSDSANSPSITLSHIISNAKLSDGLNFRERTKMWSSKAALLGSVSLWARLMNRKVCGTYKLEPLKVIKRVRSMGAPILETKSSKCSQMPLNVKEERGEDGA